MPANKPVGRPDGLSRFVDWVTGDRDGVAGMDCPGDRAPGAGDPAMMGQSIMPHFDVDGGPPRAKRFDEAQAYGAGVRAVMGMDHLSDGMAAVHRRCKAALGRGERVVLTVNGVEVATFEPWT